MGFRFFVVPKVYITHVQHPYRDELYTHLFKAIGECSGGQQCTAHGEDDADATAAEPQGFDWKRPMCEVRRRVLARYNHHFDLLCDEHTSSALWAFCCDELYQHLADRNATRAARHLHGEAKRLRTARMIWWSEYKHGCVEVYSRVRARGRADGCSRYGVPAWVVP